MRVRVGPEAAMPADLTALQAQGWEVTIVILRRPLAEGTPERGGPRCHARHAGGAFCTRFAGHGGTHASRRAWGERQAGVAKLRW
jgi:hypothetical protein